MSDQLDRIRGALASAAALAPQAAQLEKLGCRLEIRAEDAVIFSCGEKNPAPSDIVIRANEATWAQAFCEYPEPGFQSLGALYRLQPDVQVTGEPIKFMQALPIVEELLESARVLLYGHSTAWSFEDDLTAIEGHYAKSGSHWIYFEKSGQPDKPLICMLHTAGADSRQWHGLMSMTELQQNWQMVAFDMPGHGRSPLPDSSPNWQWHLTETQYVDIVSTFIRSQLKQPVILMGCSMGAAVGLPLLAQHPDLFKAAILLETPYHSPGRRSPYLDHPSVHGGRLSATWVASLLSPHSPMWRRNLARWIYSQSAPSVYDGDLAFYSDEFRASNHTARIDTNKTPLWLLTGDYDYSASPSETARVAAEIPGCRFQTMHGFGHFPMTEDPHRLFQNYLADILRELSSKR